VGAESIMKNIFIEIIPVKNMHQLNYRNEYFGFEPQYRLKIASVLF